MISTVLVIYLQLARALESRFSNNMETFNEGANIISLYMLQCFSDFVQKSEVRSQCGWYFITIIIVYALAHLSIIFRDTIKKVML